MITQVYIWQNGNVMVFGEDDSQMPEFQGHKDDKLPLIMKWIEDHPEREVRVLYNARWR